MSPSSPAKKPRSLGQIEFMRALAVTGIFLFHLWSVIPAAGVENPFGPVFGVLLSQGWMGVILFNIVTGFVLTLPFAGPSGRPVPGYLDFLRRRFLRICPNYYISLVFWTAVLVFTGHAGTKLLGSFVQHLIFVHTLNPAVFFDIVPAYWWLGLLAQFYLAYPLILKLYRRLGAKRATLWLCGGAWGLWLILEILAKAYPDSVFALANYMLYYNLPYRLPEFALGMYLISTWKDKEAGRPQNPDGTPGLNYPVLRLWAWVVLAVLAAWGLIFGVPGLAALATHLYWVAVVLCGGIIMFLCPRLHRLGSTSMVTALAGASYSIYLMHQPILGYVDNWIGNGLAPFPTFIFMAGVCGAASLLAAYILDRMVAKVNAWLG